MKISKELEGKDWNEEFSCHIIRAMSQQQVTGLCLLDLSATFVTIDYTILLHRLKSWFGFTDTSVLSWIQSYLSFRFFTFDINGIKSPISKLLYSVPQLFILYTTPSLQSVHYDDQDWREFKTKFVN